MIYMGKMYLGQFVEKFGWYECRDNNNGWCSN